MGRVVRASAPGRAGIVGNPTDMYGGSVLSITVRERAVVRIEESDVLVLSSGSERQAVRSRDDLELRGDLLDLQRAAVLQFGLDPAEFRVSISISSSVPVRSGLAGSTAIAVALTAAISRWTGGPLERHWLAETARLIEAVRMGVLCGYQDQYMAAFGGLTYLDFREKERLAGDPAEPLATVQRLDPEAPVPPLVLGHTGIMRNSGTVHRGPRQRWEEGEPQVVSAFQEIGRLARLAKKALLRSDWRELGRLMDRNHELVSGLGMSNDANDRLIEAARRAGAFGAKLAGAGKGGTIIAVAERPEDIGRALLDAGAESVYYPFPSPGVETADEVCSSQ